MPEDISIVVNTHLHFDHAGGNTVLEREIGRKGDGEISDLKFQISNSENQKPKTEDQNLIPQFPNARYFVSESELEAAENPHERDRASYLSENWRPLQERGQLELKPDNYEVVEGLTMQTVRGHSATMQTVKLEREGKILYGFADLIPTTAHLSLPWIMGYDLFPTETLEAKRKLLTQAVEEDWICLFYHDFEMPLCRLESVEGKIKPKEI
jgi:glyoxylase-like metal-dependent hydrolase (beta-lactamase superfamily II)